MTEQTTYDATARRDGQWWLVQVPELDTVGQASGVAEVEEVAREIIGLSLNRPAGLIQVAVRGGDSPRAIANQYAAGELTADEAVELLGLWPYAPASDANHVDVAGTWVEVVDALGEGLISEDVYGRAFQRKYGELAHLD